MCFFSFNGVPLGGRSNTGQEQEIEVEFVEEWKD